MIREWALLRRYSTWPGQVRFALCVCPSARELYPPLACANHPLTRARARTRAHARTHTRWRTVALEETAVPFRQRRSCETDYRTRNEYLIRESLFSRYVQQSLLCPRWKRRLGNARLAFGLESPRSTRTLAPILSYALAN